MRFSSQFIDSLRQNIQISAIIRNSRKPVTLHQKGRYLVGLCPFHSEKTPSFTVSDERQSYHCFGCGAHGDAISFLVEQENLSFTEAVEQLAKIAGIPLPKPDKQFVKQEEEREVLRRLLDIAREWFHKQLFTAGAKESRDYLQQRGINQAAIERFQLGYAPSQRTLLSEYLQKQGFDYEQIHKAGLAGISENGEYYELFRQRIMFPIHDARYQVVAFGGRALQGGQPKYLNSPETMLFKKSEILYGESLARKAVFSSDRLVMVEGYMDVIAMHMAGFEYTVAPLGTAITERHLQRAWHLHKSPTLCLDGDIAGMKAMQRIAVKALPLIQPSYSLYFALLPKGLDPDDMLQRYGKGHLEECLTSALVLSEALWQAEAVGDVSLPETRGAINQRCQELVAKINHPILKAHYRRFFEDRLWHAAKSVRFAKAPKPNAISSIYRRSQLSACAILADISVIERCQQTLLWMILKVPTLLKEAEIEASFIDMEWASERYEKFAYHLAKTILESEEMTNDQLMKDISEKGYGEELKALQEQGLFHHHFSATLNLETIKTQWRYTLNYYYITVIQSEYQFHLSQMNDTGLEKARLLAQQIEVLQQAMAKMADSVNETEEFL